MNGKKILYSVVGLLLVVIIGVYAYQINFFKQHYLPQSKANGIDISQLTLKEAEKTLAAHNEKENFELLENGQVWQAIPKKELGIEYNYTDSLKTILMNQNKNLWIVSYFKKNSHKLTDSSLNEEKLALVSEKLTKELTELNKERTPTTNATIKKSKTGFDIIPEVQGDNLAVVEILTDLKKALTSGKNSLALEDYKIKPTVLADNDELKKNLVAVSQITDQQTQYLIGGQTIDIPKESIAEWIDYDQKNNKIALDKEKIRAYVADLGANYNTSSNPTTFKSTARGEVSVPAGSYSWTIQTDEEADELYNELLQGQGVSRSPIISGSASSGSPLVENTYVEVDLQNQHMYFYKNGKLELDTNIVSGRPTMATPIGVNYVWKKERDSYLRGTNEDGSKYKTQVAYWMPIDWIGIGLHDSPWQPAYGGNLWSAGAGSHGCINTPPDVAAKLFESIDVGTPVVVF